MLLHSQTSFQIRFDTNGLQNNQQDNDKRSDNHCTVGDSLIVGDTSVAKDIVVSIKNDENITEDINDDINDGKCGICHSRDGRERVRKALAKLNGKGISGTATLYLSGRLQTD